MACTIDNSVSTVYYSRKYEAGYYPQEEVFKIWNNWYDEHKYRLQLIRSMFNKSI